MTVRSYVHSIAKRAEAITLLDSRATENFMSLPYANWLRLPIKQLNHPRPIFNVDGTENKSGTLKYYTDLSVQTGTRRVDMRFFLTDLGEHKAIFGYPWFAAMQPKIDWARGWIDSSQLPIVLRASNTTRAIFTPQQRNVPRPTHRDQYYIGRVTFHPQLDEDPDLNKIPEEYRRHAKVFNEQASQRLPRHTVWDHAIELLPGAPHTLPG